MDDAEVFSHLQSLASDMPQYDDVVQRLILSQLNGTYFRNQCYPHTDR